MTQSTTFVYAVCDCSGSMSGAPESTMREMLRNNVQILADAEAATKQRYDVHIVPFSRVARVEMPYTASEMLRRPERINAVNTHPPFGNNTALRDAIGLAADRANAAIGAGHCEAALIMVFTDGEENASVVWGQSQLAATLKRLDESGKFTITVAGPQLVLNFARTLGIAADNCRLWDGSVQELRKTDAATRAALSTYTESRSKGATRSTRFYADASALTPAGIKANTKQVTPTAIRTVTKYMAGRTISDYFGAEFQQGRHFYELVKPEYVQDGKDLIVFIKSQNQYRLGSRSIRQLLNLPETGKIRVHPSGKASDNVIFVRSESNNRKVVEGQQLLTVGE